MKLRSSLLSQSLFFTSPHCQFLCVGKGMKQTFVSVVFFISSLTNTLDVIHIKHNVCLFHTEYVFYTIYYDVFSRVYRRVWRYQRGNQNPYIIEEQTTQWPKEKGQTTIYYTCLLFTTPKHFYNYLAFLSFGFEHLMKFIPETRCVH
jgi:hypothetical protein